MSSTPAEGDGLDELRAQIKAHEPMSREAKLEAARQELLQEEAYCLIQYDAAKKIGESLTPHDLVMSSRPLVLLLWRDIACGTACAHGPGHPERLALSHGVQTPRPACWPCLPLQVTGRRWTRRPRAGSFAPASWRC